MNIRKVQPTSRWLWFFVLLFILLGLGYDSLTPIFENSDETLHYPYVKNIADGKGLPLAVPGKLWNQEGTQPPLYYAIVAATTAWINTDNLPDFLQYNPHWLYTDVRALINDNQNLVLHGPMDAFPYQGAALAIHIGRWWSLVFGLLTIAGVFWLARQLFPHHLPLAITATALTALNPQFVRVSATVSNDSLSAALTTLAVLAAFKFTRLSDSAIQRTSAPAHQRTSKSTSFTPALRPQEEQSAGVLHPSSFIPHPSSLPIILGLLTGLALLTKLSSLTTLLLVAFVVFVRLFVIGELHESPLKTVLRWIIIIVAVTALLSGWWFWRNYQLYGEWFATETHLNLAGRADISLADAWNLRHEAERAYWATFGWGQIRPPEWVYQLFFWFSRIGLVGLCLAIVGRLAQYPKTRPLPINLDFIRLDRIIILLLWAGLSLALYLRWVMEVGSVSHTRLMFPAIAAISLLLALGWHALIPRRLAAWFSGTVVALLLALNLYSLGWLLYPAFTPTTTAPANTAINFIPHSSSLILHPLPTINLTFLDSLKLTGGQIYQQGDPTATKPQASQGDTVMVSAMWQVLAQMNKNYSVAAVLLAPDGQVLGRRETYPGLGLRPTRYLTPGDSFVDVYPLKLTGDAAEPVVARAAVNLFDFESATRAGFPALDERGLETTPIVGQIKITPKTWPVYQPQQAARVNFNQAITLIGYDLSPDRSALTLYWQSQAMVEADYVVFIHLLDADGQVIAQADGPPTGNAYPTSWWSPGEIIADRHALPGTPDAVALWLGLYDLASGQRLPMAETTLPAQDNSVEIKLP